jgi:glycosyltransferase involved in cell wall biosynthesis
MGFERPLLWVNDPAGATVLEATRWPALYDITDDWAEAERTPAEHERVLRDEALLIQHCREVVVCSPRLAQTKGALRPVTLVQNGVDLAAYQTPHTRPADLPDGPVAVYVGTLHTDRIDVGLCVRTAQALTGRGRLVLVGPVALDPPDRERLERAGVVVTGPRHRDEVPAYLQHADVLVVPHVVTPFTDSLDPIKVYEYRAVGRPVVSTPVAGFRELDDPPVHLAQADEFAASVRTAVPAETTFPEGADPDVPTWGQRVREMAAVLDRLARPATEPATGSP